MREQGAGTVMREQVQGRERFPSSGHGRKPSTEVGVCLWWTQSPAGASTQEWGCRTRISRGSLASWASVSPRWRPGPSCPVASPSPSPRGCREKREPGPAAKMSPQGVLRLSRLSQAEFHAQPLGTVGARGAFHHLGLGSPLGTVFIWP